NQSHQIVDELRCFNERVPADILVATYAQQCAGILELINRLGLLKEGIQRALNLLAVAGVVVSVHTAAIGLTILALSREQRELTVRQTENATRSSVCSAVLGDPGFAGRVDS